VHYSAKKWSLDELWAIFDSTILPIPDCFMRNLRQMYFFLGVVTYLPISHLLTPKIYPREAITDSPMF